MLIEVKEVRQYANEGFRRWFFDDFFDLIVWYYNSRIYGFQLCYDIKEFERSLTWKEDEGFSHNKIDSGEIAGGPNMSPILVPDGIFDYQEIADRFKQHAHGLERELCNFVYEKLLSAR